MKSKNENHVLYESKPDIHLPYFRPDGWILWKVYPSEEYHIENIATLECRVSIQWISAGV